MTVEEIIANRLHELGLGIYDENGVDGNIYLDNIPDVIPSGRDEIISVYQSGSFTREIKLLGGAIRPLTTIYVKGNELLKTAKKAQEIASKLSEDAYENDEFIVYQTYIFSEPVRITNDEKENFIYSMQIVQAIGNK